MGSRPTPERRSTPDRRPLSDRRSPNDKRSGGRRSLGVRAALTLLIGSALLICSALLAGCSVNGPVEGTPVQVAPNPAPPGTPTGLALSVVGDDSVLVTWDAPVAGSPLVVSYQVDLDYEQEANLAANVTSHTFSGVGSGERHTATLTAIGRASNSRTATNWILMPPDVQPTSAVPSTDASSSAVPSGSASTNPAPNSSTTTSSGWGSGWG